VLKKILKLKRLALYWSGE